MARLDYRSFPSAAGHIYRTADWQRYRAGRNALRENEEFFTLDTHIGSCPTGAFLQHDDLEREPWRSWAWAGEYLSGIGSGILDMQVEQDGSNEDD